MENARSNKCRSICNQDQLGAARSARTHACLMGLVGLVSKHKDRPYRAGRSPHWLKVKNRKHPAMSRVMDTFS